MPGKTHFGRHALLGSYSACYAGYHRPLTSSSLKVKRLFDLIAGHEGSQDKIEEENHFLLDCKAYSQIRDIFFSKLETKIPDFKSLSHDTLISLLMNSSDYLINCQLVSFISQCFELRTKLISMNE